MDPKFWGPGLWRYLHSAAATSDTPEKREAFHKLVIALGVTIPCDVCKAHFLENQRKFDIRSHKKDQETLLLWTYLMHDAVNQAQGKTGNMRPSFAVIRAQYFDVGNDVGAVGPVETDGAVCQEICTNQAVVLTSAKSDAQNQKTLKISAKNSRK